MSSIYPYLYFPIGLFFKPTSILYDFATLMYHFQKVLNNNKLVYFYKVFNEKK